MIFVLVGGGGRLGLFRRPSKFGDGSSAATVRAGVASRDIVDNGEGKTAN
jgi:hypothetical protein